MLQATEKGQTVLPPRLNRAPGLVHNEAKALREQREKEKQLEQEEKENKRKKRDELVKNTLKSTKFGGREMPL